MAVLRRTGTPNIRRLNQAGCTSTCAMYTSERSKVDRSVSSSAGAAVKGCGMAFLDFVPAGLTARCLVLGGMAKATKLRKLRRGLEEALAEITMC